MKNQIAGVLSALAVTGWLASTALAGTLVINTDTSDPAPKQAMQELIDGFKEAHPDVEVEWNLFDHE
ncbi:MAG: carbohydrate ABC transporter substrate-binding protein, partial [Geminicoccaceae bacterium]